MTIREALDEVRKRLECFSGEAASEAEIILSEATGRERWKLFLEGREEISGEQQEKLEGILKRREDREPLQYILGKAWFRDFELAVGPEVLIPRPETEILVELVLDHLKERGMPEISGSAPRLVDVGTGSGAIAIALARECPDIEVTAVDLSPQALERAEQNARGSLPSGTEIRFLCSDLLEGMPGGSFDAVVANLPYVAEEQMPRLQPEVRREPELALNGKKEGLVLIRRLIMQAESVLPSGGLAALEVGEGQATAVAETFSEGPWRGIQVVPDYAGIARFVLAIRG